MINIKIKIDTDQKKDVEMELTNENFNNYNFIEMIVEDTVYTIPLKDLSIAVNALVESAKNAWYLKD